MRKKLTFALVLALCMALLCLGAWADDTFSGGTGTEDDPYQISNADDTEALRDSVNNDNETYKGKYFRLTNDINLGTNVINPWEPIGTSATNSFQGSFDGDGHRISGLYVNNSGYAGLFATVGSTSATGAEIKNLHVDGSINVTKKILCTTSAASPAFSVKAPK